MDYQNNNSNNNQGFTNNINSSNNIDFDTELEKMWMGDLYDKAYSKKFSWCATMLGPTYFFYKKMYLVGTLLTTILVFLINILIILASNLTMNSVMLFVIIMFFPVTRILCGFSFYPLYKNFVHKKINKLKQNITDNSQLINEVSRRRKPSFISVVMAGIHTYYVGGWLVMVGLGLCFLLFPPN